MAGTVATAARRQSAHSGGHRRKGLLHAAGLLADALCCASHLLQCGCAVFCLLLKPLQLLGCGGNLPLERLVLLPGYFAPLKLLLDLLFRRFQRVQLLLGLGDRRCQQPLFLFQQLGIGRVQL